MFSLHKNYIKEQQNLIHELQETIINQNLSLNELKTKLEMTNKLIPYFKQIAQILAYYCNDNDTLVTCPSGVTAANLILEVINHCEANILNDEVIEKVDSGISNWEKTIIEKLGTIDENDSNNT